MKEQEWLGNVIYPDWGALRRKALEELDRENEMEDAITLGRDCACWKNDANCPECWTDKFPPVGASMMNLSQFDKDVRNRFDECLELLLRKHLDYGPSNIGNAPGGPLNGLRVRIHDKVARVNHLIDSGVEPSNESLRDSFLDLANYSVIALLVLDDAWPTK